VLSCIPCNVKKGSRLLAEVGMSLVAPRGSRCGAHACSSIKPIGALHGCSS
jgi:hypothetical protein